MPSKQPHNACLSVCWPSSRLYAFLSQFAGKALRWLARGATALVLFILVQGVTFSAPLSVAVLYPDVPDPYQGIFLEIIAGINKRIGSGVHTYVLESGFDVGHIKAWIQEHNINVIIALGRRGLNAATAATDK